MCCQCRSRGLWGLVGRWDGWDYWDLHIYTTNRGAVSSLRVYGVDYWGKWRRGHVLRVSVRASGSVYGKATAGCELVERGDGV